MILAQRTYRSPFVSMACLRSSLAESGQVRSFDLGSKIVVNRWRA